MDADKALSKEQFSWPWYRLHFSTCLVMLLPAASLVLANITGERTPVFCDRYTWSTKDSEFEHGWPQIWLVRECEGNSDSPWAITQSVCCVDWSGVPVNLAVATVLLSVSAAIVEWRRRRRGRVWQFTISDLLLAVLVISIGLRWITDRRAAIANVVDAVELTGFQGNLEWATPCWLESALGHVEAFDTIVWQSGMILPDETDFGLPEDEESLAVAHALLACGSRRIVVAVQNETKLDSGTAPRQFDPDVLCSLHGLERLFLERADDEVLTCFESLTDLRRLTFDKDCGPMSAEGAARLKRLTKLRSLRASRKCLGDAGIAALPSLKQLEALSLAGANDADVPYLGELTRLRHLELPIASITDEGLAPLANLTRLETVSLESLRINGSGLASMNGMRRLRSLTLFGCGLTDDGLAGLRDLNSLEHLCLDYTPITGPGLVHLAPLQRLRWLDLSRTEIGDSALEKLPNLPALEDLSLVSTRVTENSLAAVNRFHTLRELCLINTRVASFGQLHLDRLPRLFCILCGSSWVSHDERERLWSLRPDITFEHRGQRLDFHSQFEYFVEQAHKRWDDDQKPIRVFFIGSDFGDRELAMLSGLPALEALRLESTQVDDVGLACVDEFQRLQEVDLTGSAISDTGLERLSVLPKLRQLDVSYTDVTTEGIAAQLSHHALELIGLDPSQVTVKLTDELKRLPTLKRVRINRDRAPWGNQYRGARDFSEFLDQLREDLRDVDITVKEFAEPFHTVEY